MAVRSPVEIEFSLVMAAPFGCVGVEANESVLLKIQFLPKQMSLVKAQNALAHEAELQFKQYFNQANFVFDLPLQVEGTSFQRKVWQQISNIPCGSTKYYAELAQALKSAAQAVGQACGANPFPIVVPCHRVSAKNGLGGFAHARDGWLLDTKRWLLHHEGAL